MDKAQKIRMMIGNEEACVKEYMTSGPDALASFLGVNRLGEAFKEIFKYFVFEKDLIFKCAISHIETVQEIMVMAGPYELRKVMGIADSEFDPAFESVFDIVGLGCRSFYKYVVSHKDELSKMLVSEGPETMRKYLCIVNEKYDNLWKAVMDLIVAEFSKEKIKDRMIEHKALFDRVMPKLQEYLRMRGLME